MRHEKGFSLIEIIVALAIMAVLAAAIVPVMFNQLDQSRYTRMNQDLKAIYDGTMGVPTEGYFAYVGDMGKLPDSVSQLLAKGTQGIGWKGPYISMGATVNATDVYGRPYVIDTLPIRVRGFGKDGINNGGSGDDIFYPLNALNTFKGQLEVQVYVNGRLITNATGEQISAILSYQDNGVPDIMIMLFNTVSMNFYLSSPVHQGIHDISVTANKAVLDPATSAVEKVTILPGSTTKIQMSLVDRDYMTRTDTDLNGNGIPDRLEDMDGDGIPNSMDPDIDGDGTPNAIDPDSLNPLVSGSHGAVAPMVNNLTPSYGHQGDTNLQLTIDGSYFDNGATVTFSSSGITVLTVPATWVGSTQLKVNVNISGTATTGFRNVTVSNPSGLGGIGNNLFEVLTASGSPSPSISQVVPSSANQGDSGLLVSIQGQNFVSGATITFSNSGISIASGPTFINSNQVQVLINVSTGAMIGTGTVKLTNPDTKFDQTNFSVVGVFPYIAQINPPQAQRFHPKCFSYFNRKRFSCRGRGNFWRSYSSLLSITSYTRDSSTQMHFLANCGHTAQDREVLVIVTNPGESADTTTFLVTRK